MRSPRLGRVVAAIGLAVVVLVGIALTSSNTPIFTANEPRSTPTDPAPPPPTTTTAPTLGARPATVLLDHVDPCAVLTPSQRSALSLDAAPVAYFDEEFDHARACSIRGDQSGTVTRLALVTSMSADVWLDDDTAQDYAQVITVAGFPAVVVRTPGLTDACNVEVDTADNEFLDVMFRDGGNVPPIPQSELCVGAQRVAAAAMTTLTNRH